MWSRLMYTTRSRRKNSQKPLSERPKFRLPTDVNNSRPPTEAVNLLPSNDDRKKSIPTSVKRKLDVGTPTVQKRSRKRQRFATPIPPRERLQPPKDHRSLPRKRGFVAQNQQELQKMSSLTTSRERKSPAYLSDYDMRSISRERSASIDRKDPNEQNHVWTEWSTIYCSEPMCGPILFQDLTEDITSIVLENKLEALYSRELKVHTSPECHAL